MGSLCFVVHDPLAYGISQCKPYFYLMQCKTVIEHGKKSVKPARNNRESNKYFIKTRPQIVRTVYGLKSHS